MSSVARRFYSIIGRVKLEHIKDPIHREGVDAFLKRQEETNSEVKQVEIKGEKPHKSHNDPSDPELVISVRLLNRQGKRLGTAHVHKDGTGSVRWAPKRG